MKQAIYFLLFFALTLSACSSENVSDQNADKAGQTDVVDTDGVLKLYISSDDQMKYNKDRLEAKAGQKVKLRLTHTGSMAKNMMGHNWVLLQPGTDVVAFATAAGSAKDNDYIPEEMMEKVIAHTKMIGGGEDTVVEFTAPASGEYPFMCSFPGHYGMMKGVFVVK